MATMIAFGRKWNPAKQALALAHDTDNATLLSRPCQVGKFWMTEQPRQPARAQEDGAVFGFNASPATGRSLRGQDAAEQDKQESATGVARGRVVSV